ncbi:suppressor of fused domain protein [Fusobacterium varium]|uniref:suppressor of fused domain protein n=1 Tax=Fusobacterium varium TaxID=856 RepID=UPI002FF139E5
MKKEYIETSGWDAITRAFEKLYPEQTDPLHYAPIISWRLGGEDPLDGISVYDGGEYYHFVTYGLSELYDKESEDFDYSGYGFELTLKLKKSSLKNKEKELNCICGILQTLGRITFENGDIFQPFEYIYTGQKTGMDSKSISNITGFVTVPDEVGEINTPNGLLQFVQLVGMTDAELKTITDKKNTVEEMIEKLGHTLTDFKRKSLV